MNQYSPVIFIAIGIMQWVCLLGLVAAFRGGPKAPARLVAHITPSGEGKSFALTSNALAPSEGER